MARHGGGVAQNKEFHAGARDGDVHAPQVAQEADLACVVGPYQRNEYHIAFLALETVHGIDRYQVAEGLEEGAFLDQALQVLDLGAVGRDDAHVDAVVKDALFADALEINLQQAQGEVGLALVDAAEGLSHEPFPEIVLLVLAQLDGRGVEPQDGRVALMDEAVGDFRRRFHLSMVEIVAAELHDLIVHAVLHLQQ